VIQVDQNFGRSWHRSNPQNVTPCIIPKGKYVVTGPHWRLLGGAATSELSAVAVGGTREKCMLQGVGLEEIQSYSMEKLLGPS
ncbi:unnamed protein product, partial [Effrenium voratum]